MSGELDQRLAALREAADLAAGRLADADVERPAPSSSGRARGWVWASSRPSSRSPARPASASRSCSMSSPAASWRPSAAAGRRPPPARRRSGAHGADALLDWLEIGRRHRVDATTARRPRPARPSRLRLDRGVAPARGRARRRARRPRALGRRAAEVRRRVAARPLPPPAGDTRRRDGRRAQPGRPARARRKWKPGATDMETPARARRPAEAAAVVVSARDGDGIPELRRLLADRVAAREAAVAKLAADLEPAARPARRALRGHARTASGARTDGGSRRRSRRPRACRRSCAPSATRTGAAVRSRRAGRSSAGSAVSGPTRYGASSPRVAAAAAPEPRCPPPTDVQRAQVASAARRLADGAAEGLAQPWPRLVREAATAADDQVADRLDRAVAGADLSVSRPRWWRLAGLAPEPPRGRRRRRRRLARRARGFRLAQDRGRRPAPGGTRDSDPDVAPPRRRGGRTGAGLSRAARERRRREASRAQGGPLAPRAGEAVAQELVLGPVETELDTHGRLCAAVERAGKR